MLARQWWHMPVIPGSQEAEAGASEKSVSKFKNKD